MILYTAFRKYATSLQKEKGKGERKDWKKNRNADVRDIVW